MGILGIKNRTENWKTARSFVPFFRDEIACQELAGRLLKPLGKELAQDASVKIELFWRGGRDYVHGSVPASTDRRRKTTRPRRPPARIVIGKAFSEPYKCLFDDLRGDLQDFGITLPNYINYCPNAPKGVKRLAKNILNTEIDIVLETRRHLFIGEAKDESQLGRNGKYVLMHQLIRQYVTARILTEIICSVHRSKRRKSIVPFIVANRKKLDSIRNDAQVEFMVHQGWLKEDNILSWEDIEAIRRSV